MARKKKQAPPGAPEWMVTFGDMMSLLLCFFVILVSMSEIKEDKRFQEVTESIRKAFGVDMSIGLAPGENVPTNTWVPKMVDLVTQILELNKGRSHDEGIEGENPSVLKIREGMEYIIGGKISFEEGKAELLSPAKQNLATFCEGIKGENLKIRVRGHAARKPPSRYRPYASLSELSYARGMAIKAFMENQGIRSERITVEACGDNEPIISQAYDETDRARNRRVSIIVTENLVEEFQGQVPIDTGDILDG